MTTTMIIAIAKTTANTKGTRANARAGWAKFSISIKPFHLQAGGR
jgi:hypothetical protein